MNRVFAITKNITGIDENMISVSFPLTVKVRRISPVDETALDERLSNTIESIIEGEARIALATNTIDNVYYHTYRFIKEIYEMINMKLDLIDYYIVDIQIGKISDEANYINNIESYHNNKLI